MDLQLYWSVIHVQKKIGPWWNAFSSLSGLSRHLFVCPQEKSHISVGKVKILPSMEKRKKKKRIRKMTASNGGEHK